MKIPNMPKWLPSINDTMRLTDAPKREIYLSFLKSPEAPTIFQRGLRMVIKKKLRMQISTMGRSRTIAGPKTKEINGSIKQNRQVLQKVAIQYIANKSFCKVESTCSLLPVANRFPMLPLMAAEIWFTPLVKVWNTMV